VEWDDAWPTRWAMPGLKYGGAVGLIAGLVGAVILTWSLPVRFPPGLVIWGEVGKMGGLLAGLMARVVMVMTARLSLWRRGEVYERMAAQWPSAVLCGLLGGLGVGFVFWQDVDPWAGVFLGLSTGLIGGLSHGLSNCRVVRWTDTMVVELLGGGGGGVLSWVIGGLLLEVLHGKLAMWMSFWLH
jgi:hypothetical protein